METAVDLAALDALFQAATPGEWTVTDGWRTEIECGSVTVCGYYDDHEGGGWLKLTDEDAALIAALHNAWPALRLAFEAWEADCEAVACWKALEGEEDIHKRLELSRQQQAALARWKAARARLRALRESGQ